MARKRPKGSARHSTTANRLVHARTFYAMDVLNQPLLSLIKTTPFVRSQVLSEIEDNRRWEPDPAPVSRSSRRWSVRSTLAPGRKATRRAGRLIDVQKLMFSYPRHVIRCMRRKVRDEVLHAFGKTGKGSGRKLRGRKYRRNALSNVRC